MVTATPPAGHRAGRLLCLGLLALAGGCNLTGREREPAYRTEIEALNRRLEEELRSGNLLGVADVYADDAVLLNARGERTEGRAEIDEYWSSIEHPVDWRLEIRAIRGSDALAYETGTSHLTTRRGGELHTAVVDFLLLWRRAENGEWRIALDAFWPRD